MAPRGLGPVGTGASGPLCLQRWECERAPDNEDTKSRREKEKCQEVARQPVTRRLLLTPTLPAMTRRPGERDKGGREGLPHFLDNTAPCSQLSPPASCCVDTTNLR